MSSNPDSTIMAMAVDASECSEYAFDWYVQYLHKPGNYIVCIHVPAEFDMDKAQKELAKGSQMKPSLERSYSRINELETKYTNRLRAAKVDGRVLSVPSKTPGPTLVSTAKEENAFAIIMGCRGLSKLKKAILGSVSDYVVSNAPIPVIVIRNKKENFKDDDHDSKK